MPRIDGARLLADLSALRGFGRCGTGVHRPALSATDIAARRWLAGRMSEASLAPRMDRYGTLLGRCAATRPLLIGSHTDTVPQGGWLDGALGVVCALEVARTLGQGIDVISFQDEEGTFLPCLGSRTFVGDIAQAEIDAARARDGRTLAAAMAETGLQGAPLQAEPGRYRGFLELHIEQGPVLETTGHHVGIVTGIAGYRRWRIRAEGRSDHAGTTPMGLRQDAGAALLRFAADVATQLVSAGGGPATVWNIGFSPGASNVVPAAAELSLEFRDLDDSVLARVEGWLRNRIAADRNLSGDETARFDPTPMDTALMSALEAAAVAGCARALRMPSGAGHDAMILARTVAAAMLFVPSIGGRSHDPAEDTAETDIIRGCQILCDAAEILLANP
jgi:beta-ureidopropionase / N-carbamoyl-L-amino-acid hydrolase